MKFIPLVVFFCVLAYGARIPLLSFEAPFNDVSATGTRLVSDWKVQGDAQALQHFVRVTPDRQSKRGAVWSPSSTQLPEQFSFIFRFRISGQAKQLFGDGVAVWIVNAAHYQPGQFHGHTDKFDGIGIAFDTFRNSEVGVIHKDVAVFLNDGTKTVEQMNRETVGCDAKLRYHEGRSDFTFQNSSRARVEYVGNTLTIDIDARNTGEWVNCVVVNDIKLSENWRKGAHLGITASTGSLADNHDVLSLVTYDNADEAEANDIHHFQSNATEIQLLMENVEHQFTAVNEALRNNINKIKDQEKILEGRVKALEDKLGEKIKGTIEERVSKLEGFNIQKIKEKEIELIGRIKDLEERLSIQYNRKLEDRISVLEDKVDHKVNLRLAKLEQAVIATIESRVKEGVDGNNRWLVIPFVFLFIVIAIVTFFFFQKYRWLKKSHLI